MDLSALLELYHELQSYVGWTDQDQEQLKSLHQEVAPNFSAIIDDFYDELRRHPAAMKTITGGDAQIELLKQTLNRWLQDLFHGPYDEPFVSKRFRVGQKHVEIGLAPYFVNAALSRIRSKLEAAAYENSTRPNQEVEASIESLNRLLDLDLAIIEFAYQTEFTAREQRIERLATMGQIAAGIAHELRNPLNAIKTSVYYLLNARQPTPDKQREHLKRIDRQVTLSDRTITALSDFARMPQPNLEAIELPNFISQVLEANPVPPNVDVSIDCPTNASQLLADSSQLSIAVGNLVRNAVDAMPDGGQLTIRVNSAATGSPDELSTILLEVIDTGTGIPSEIINRIMEPLFSTKSRGLGLGLALSRAIVEKHNGRLSVVSTPGAGATFSIALPSLNATDDPLLACLPHRVG